GDTLILGGPDTVLRNATTGALTPVDGPVDMQPDMQRVALPDGRALVFGVSAKAALGSGYVYQMRGWAFDPVAKTFTATPNPLAGGSPRGVLLPTGKVLHVNQGASEIWDPVTNTMT